MPILELLIPVSLVVSAVIAYAAALDTDALVRRGAEPGATPRLDFALSLVSLGTWAAFAVVRNAQTRRTRAASLGRR
jgi:hypothetical protein